MLHKSFNLWLKTCKISSHLQNKNANKPPKPVVAASQPPESS